MKKPYEFIPDLTEGVDATIENTHPTANIQGRAIYTDKGVKILLFPFAPGQALREHSTPHASILHVIKGAGEVTLVNDTKPVKEGSWVIMEPGLPHSIHAQDNNLVVLLHVFMDEKTGH